MPVYIVSHSDYDSYDPHYVFHDRIFSKEAFKELVDAAVVDASECLLKERKEDIAKGNKAWYIDWDSIVGKAVELLCRHHGFCHQRFVSADYFGGVIYNEHDRRASRRMDDDPLVPEEVMQYNSDIRKGLYEKYLGVIEGD